MASGAAVAFVLFSLFFPKQNTQKVVNRVQGRVHGFRSEIGALGTEKHEREGQEMTKGGGERDAKCLSWNFCLRQDGEV
jgi:hypothetical protein